MEFLPNINSPEDLKKLNIEELKHLAYEIREQIVGTVKKNGGHLSSNLGVVELTLALHYVFNSPDDKIIFDVGHQSYTHKLITGRRDDFNTLRTFNGISGFPKSTESEHDAFNTGHSSTSISAALGMCKARELSGDKYSVISVIGDGAISGGMAFEALNNIGLNHGQMLIVLNDNEMSISKNVGALSDQLSKIRVSKKYLRFKERTKKVLREFPIFGDDIERLMRRTRNVFKQILVRGMIFEQFGLKYLGPIDGHNIGDMISLIEEAKKLNRPVLLHVVTQKGKGYKNAENEPENYHGFSPTKYQDSFTNHFGKTIVELAEKNKNIVAITAAMSSGTGLKDFERYFPERFIDVGICEQHAVTFAAGMAKRGLKPFVCIYSTFLQRAYDQILHDVCLQNLPVVFCIDRAGINPRDGETHHGIYDISFLKNLPNIEVFTPYNFCELTKVLSYAESAKNPVAIRYPHGDECHVDTIANYNDNVKQWQKITDNNARTTILAVGSRMTEIALASSKIAKANVVAVTCIKPLDTQLLNSLEDVITLEDGIKNGGFYGSIAEFYSEKNVSVTGFGYAMPIPQQGDMKSLLELSNITPEVVAKACKNNC